MSLIRVWVSDYLEDVLFGKWELANKFSVSKVDCDSNILLSACKELKISLFEEKTTMYLLKNSSCQLNIVSNTFKAK